MASYALRLTLPLARTSADYARRGVCILIRVLANIRAVPSAILEHYSCCFSFQVFWQAKQCQNLRLPYCSLLAARGCLCYYEDAIYSLFRSCADLIYTLRGAISGSGPGECSWF